MEAPVFRPAGSPGASAGPVLGNRKLRAGVMKTEISLDKCRSYIDSQWQAQARSSRGIAVRSSGPAITVSRQAGSGAHSLAPQLAAFLDKYGPKGQCPWTVFDRELVETVLEEHHLPKDFARFMPEDRISYLDEVMEELLGLHPSSWTLVRQTTETVLHLADMGRVILVGRGANVITARLPNVFHVRLTGSVERRTERVMEHYGLSKAEALRFLRKEDRGRERYLQKHFQARIEDDLLYHLVLNTDRIALAEAVQIIGAAALRQFQAGER